MSKSESATASTPLLRTIDVAKLETHLRKTTTSWRLTTLGLCLEAAVMHLLCAANAVNDTNPLAHTFAFYVVHLVVGFAVGVWWAEASTERDVRNGEFDVV